MYVIKSVTNNGLLCEVKCKLKIKTTGKWVEYIEAGIGKSTFLSNIHVLVFIFLMGYIT